MARYLQIMHGGNSTHCVKIVISDSPSTSGLCILPGELYPGLAIFQQEKLTQCISELQDAEPSELFCKVVLHVHVN